MNNDNNYITVNQNGEEIPETLEQKRNNVIEKINNLIDLGVYVKKKKINLQELNDEDFDILIYAIEHSNSVHMIEYILSQTQYDTLNYSFYDSGKYNSFLVSVMDQQIDNKGFKVPLFSAIAMNKFKIADLLLKKNADINFLINGRDYHNVNILYYLYYMSGYKDFLNRNNLKYILHNGFHKRFITTDVVNKMMNRNYSDGLLEILLKHCIYDNDFIIHLLMIYHQQEAMTDHEIQEIILQEKNKITIDDGVYDNADERENYEAINMILDYDGNDQEIINERIEEYELLEKAVEYNNYHLVQKILNYPFIKVENLHLQEALCEASKSIHVEILSLLLEYLKNKPNLDWKMINFENILLETSRYHNIHYLEERKLKHITVMKYLIEAVLNISFDHFERVNISFLKTFKSQYFNLIINILIKMGHLPFIKYLLENEELKSSIDIDVKDRNDECPLMTAYHVDHMEIFNYLLDYGANYNIRNSKDGRPLLSLALQNKNYMAIKHLLKQNFTFDEENTENYHIYQWIQQNNIEKIIALFQKDPEELMRNNNSEEERNEFEEVIIELKLIKNNQCHFPVFGFTPLILAYLLKRQEIFEILLPHFGINDLDSNGFSILHYSILKEDIPTIIHLLDLGVEVNYNEGNIMTRGNSSLNMSISIRNKECYTIFLNCPQTDIDKPDWRGETSLMMVIKLNHYQEEQKLEIIRNLIEKGANVNYVDSSRNTPLIYAIQEKLILISEYLIQQGADLHYINDYGYNPLSFAVKKGYLPAVKLLVEHGVDINHQIESKNESKNQSILMLAMTLGEVDIVKYLIDCGVEINFNNLNIFYEIIESINKTGKKEIFEYMAERRIDIFTSHIVNEIISLNRLDLIKILIENKLDVNIRDENGNIPLTYAIKFNERRMVAYLIEHGANIFNVNHLGQTIYELCRECYDPNNNNSISIYNKIKRLIENHKV